MHAAVIGGSLGGLSAAVVLRDRGFDVDVYERSDSTLKSRGAGIVLHEATTRYLIEKGVVELDDISAFSRRTRYIDARGDTVHDFAITYRFSSWSSLYRALLSCFDRDHYHLGHNFVSFSDEGTQVRARFEQGLELDCDLLVCADGISSTARSTLLPQVVPVYSGYVGWRGTVSEEELTPETLAAPVRDDPLLRTPPDGHMLAYPIPNVDGTLSQGQRLINFIWYRNVAAGEDLEALMTDRSGVLRSISMPPGSARDEFVDELRSAAEKRLPPIFRELVARTRKPFIQQVLDVEVPRMTFGRTCLIGDAAFTARPPPRGGHGQGRGRRLEPGAVCRRREVRSSNGSGCLGKAAPASRLGAGRARQRHGATLTVRKPLRTGRPLAGVWTLPARRLAPTRGECGLDVDCRAAPIEASPGSARGPGFAAESSPILWNHVRPRMTSSTRSGSRWNSLEILSTTRSRTSLEAVGRCAALTGS